MNIIEEQSNLEKEMRLVGVTKFHKQAQDHIKKGSESTSYFGILMMKNLVLTLAVLASTFRKR
jgi:hypothetical protein